MTANWGLLLAPGALPTARASQCPASPGCAAQIESVFCAVPWHRPELLCCSSRGQQQLLPDWNWAGWKRFGLVFNLRISQPKGDSAKNKVPYPLLQLQLQYGLRRDGVRWKSGHEGGLHEAAREVIAFFHVQFPSGALAERRSPRLGTRGALAITSTNGGVIPWGDGCPDRHCLLPFHTALVPPAPSDPYSLMHLFMSVLRRPKYPSGQDGRQIPICRISFLSRRMKSLGEHLRHPLNSEHRSQPLAQPWLSSVLTARAREAAVGAQLCRGALYTPSPAPQHRHHGRDGHRSRLQGLGSRCTDTVTMARGTAPAQPGARCPEPWARCWTSRDGAVRCRSKTLWLILRCTSSPAASPARSHSDLAHVDCIWQCRRFHCPQNRDVSSAPTFSPRKILNPMS